MKGVSGDHCLNIHSQTKAGFSRCESLICMTGFSMKVCNPGRSETWFHPHYGVSGNEPIIASLTFISCVCPSCLVHGIVWTQRLGFPVTQRRKAFAQRPAFGAGLKVKRGHGSVGLQKRQQNSKKLTSLSNEPFFHDHGQWPMY